MSDTGGEWTLTQWVHCEFIVSFEAIRPVVTQQVYGEFFQKVPTKVPTGYFLNETPEFVSKEPTKLPSGYFLNECSEFFQKVPINLIKMYLAGSFQSIHNELSIWSSFTTNSQRTCQVMVGYILIKLMGTF